MDGSTFFWSCLVSLWFFADMKFQVDWMGWVYKKLLRHTHKDTFTKSRDPELWRIFCWLVGAQPQPIASNLQASCSRKMGMFCSALSTSWIEIPPTSLPLSIDFWDDSSLNAFGHSVPRVPPGDESSQAGKTGEPYGFLGNIRGITTSPLRILWQLHLSILSNGMVYPLSGSYIDRILGDGDYLDLFVCWLGKKSPNGGEKWWFTMVESVKNHQLNKPKL